MAKALQALTPIMAIIGLTIMEVVALANGINGTMLLAVSAAVAGIGGYQTKVVRDVFKRAKGG